MACYNKVILMGNLVRDPELRTVSSGSKVASLVLAVSETWKDRNGQTQERACFVDIEVWNRGPSGRLADLCAQYLSKGSSILVEGRLEQHDWISKKTGEKRSKLRVNADAVKFLNTRPASYGAATEASGDKESDLPVSAPQIPASAAEVSSSEQFPF
jgi:single-strand DNA-binding protein